MKVMTLKIFHSLNRVPSQVYLWIAILIFASSNSVTRKVIEIGKNHLVNGRNPISLCNILFVGNICALLVMIAIFHQEGKPSKLKKLTRNDWISLTVIGILSGGIIPALVFAALDQTNVTNIVLIGRLEPPLGIALSVWLLGSRVNTWTVAGSLISSAGVAVTALLGSSGQMVTMMGGFQLGKGELFIAIAAIISAVVTIISKLRLQSISLGFFSIFRTAVGTVIFFILANVLYGSEHFAEAFSPFLWEWMFLYAAVIVVVGQLCWFAALKDTTLAESELGGSCSPIIAIFMAYLILGEVPNLPQYLGGIIIMIGIVLSFIGSLRQTKMAMKPIRLTPANTMRMAVGFKGI